MATVNMNAPAAPLPLDVARIDEQTKLETELKRSLTSTERLVFERGFISGSIHGIRDCRAELAKAPRR